MLREKHFARTKAGTSLASSRRMGYDRPSRSPDPAMNRSRLKNAAVLATALLLAILGLYNIFLKATWTLMDDGVFWKEAPHGLVASRVAAGGPGDRAGIRTGDTLLAMDGEEALTAQGMEERLARRVPGSAASYTVLRADERRALTVEVEPLAKG